MKKRSFKIATAFAGAAAATMGLGTAALAATALPASRSGKITNRICSSGTKTWVHLYYGTGHQPECFGNAGWTTASANIAVACPGNNNGWLNLRSSPYRVFLVAGTGNSYIGGKHVTQVGISDWSGHATC